MCRGLSLGVEKLAELFGVFAAVSSSSRAVRLWVPDCTGPPLVSVPVSTNALCLTEVCTRQEGTCGSFPATTASGQRHCEGRNIDCLVLK